MKPDITLPVRVYGSSRRGQVSSAPARAAGELWRTRGILWRLFLRDLTAQYRQKLLGFFWAFLDPLLAIASFLFLYYAGILQPGELAVAYPLYVILGTTLWGGFLAVTQTVGDGLRTHGDLLLRTGLPKIALTVAGLAN